MTKVKESIETNKIVITQHFFRDEWICICGKKPIEDGFFPIDEDGNEVELSLSDPRPHGYVCGRCGRVVNPDTLEVTRQIDLATIKWLS